MRGTRILVSLAAAALLALAGCATDWPYDGAGAAEPAAAALGVDDLVQMLQAGRPQPQIAEDVQSRGLRAELSPADIDALLAAGAHPELIIAAQAAPQASDAAFTIGAAIDGVPGWAVGPWIAADWLAPWFPFGPGAALGFGYYTGGSTYARRPVHAHPAGPGLRPAPRVGSGPPQPAGRHFSFRRR